MAVQLLAGAHLGSCLVGRRPSQVFSSRTTLFKQWSDWSSLTLTSPKCSRTTTFFGRLQRRADPWDGDSGGWSVDCQGWPVPCWGVIESSRTKCNLTTTDWIQLCLTPNGPWDWQLGRKGMWSNTVILWRVISHQGVQFFWMRHPQARRPNANLQNACAWMAKPKESCGHCGCFVVLKLWHLILGLKFSGKSHPFSHSQNWKKAFKIGIGRICWWHHYISSPSIRKQTLDPGTVVRIRIFWILQMCGQRCKQRLKDVPDWRDGIGIHGDYGQRTQPPVIIAACRIFVHEDSLRPPLSLLSTRTVQRNLGSIKEVLQLAVFWWCSGLQLRELPKVWQVTVGVFSKK